MASTYPNTLDSFSIVRADATTMATTHANDHNNENDAINKIEAELGVLPKGGYASVRARLDAIVAASGTALGYLNLADYGGVGNDSTDNTTPLNNAFAALPASGGVIYAGPGIYKFTGHPTTNKSGVFLLGCGALDLYGAGGTTFKFYAGTGIGLHFGNNLAGGVTPSGVRIEGINFLDSGTRTMTLVQIENMTHYSVRNCVFRLGLIGLQTTGDRAAGPGGDSSYSMVEQCHLMLNGTGLWTDCHVTYWGGDIEVPANCTGILDRAQSSHSRFGGFKLDGEGSTGGIGVKLQGSEAVVLAAGFEQVETGIKIDGDPAVGNPSGYRNKVMGCNFTSPAGGNPSFATAYGIDITANSTSTMIGMCGYAGYTALSHDVRDLGVASSRDDRDVSYRANGFQMLTKAGTPVDGDVLIANSGLAVLDTTASKIWFRVGSTWKYATLT